MKTYSIFSHYSYMVKSVWRFDKRIVLFSICDIISNSLLPLTSCILPAIMIHMLETNIVITSLITISCGLLLAMAVLHSFAMYMKESNWYNFIFLRLEGFCEDMLMKCMVMDYALYEQDQTQNALMQAANATNNNLEGIEGFYHSNITLCTSVLGLILYMLIISRIHPLLVVLLLLLSIMQYAVYVQARNYEDRHRDEQGNRIRYQEYFYNQAYDAASGKDIRLYQAQNWLIGLFQRYHDAFQKQLSKQQGFYFLYNACGLVLQFFRDGICYAYLLYLLSNGMSISEFVLYLGIVSGFGNWFSQIAEQWAIISRCMIDIGKFRSFLDLKEANLKPQKQIEKESDGIDIVFDDVCFHYPNCEELVLKHISFHVKKKEKLALVGVNGAGKTTLVKLLCGFYKPTSGHIYVNGVSIEDLNQKAYFEDVAVLFQDSTLLSYSIAENITGQKADACDHERLIKVLKESDLYEKVMNLPEKENTFIGKDLKKNGIQLSGGQKQKLFLARALYKDAPLLLLDEPTAALDPLAESAMYEKYHALVQDKTSFFISHRLSSTRFCDRIFFMQDGEIKEEGTHEALMKKQGLYAHMFHVQSQYYKEEGDHDVEIDA